ncbi:uncharacterized protein LOC108289198 [Cebus imitator]|uniref:uncharacterized protein LOC108289198 n=1 Tax=Cebus imitator TaxID=2715852 RepID=UPI00189A9059|nr:uncharacterized protein LOC108289198 [Cebus imitator]
MAAAAAAAVTQASRRERQQAQGDPNGCGASELSAGSGAGPGQALGSRGVFRRRSLTSTSAAATASSSLPLPPRPSTGAARSTPGNAPGGVAESSPSGAALSSAYVPFPFPLHCPKCRRSQREGLKPKWGGVGRLHSLPFRGLENMDQVLIIVYTRGPPHLGHGPVPVCAC